ncbi:MAG: hypothetical protein OXT09_15970 [Myxococcales bacterium]|nr:hypothetical protein [Myxococcales bacterium]
MQNRVETMPVPHLITSAVPRRQSLLGPLAAIALCGNVSTARAQDDGEAPPPPPKIQTLDDDEGDGKAAPIDSSEAYSDPPPSGKPGKREKHHGMPETHDGFMLRAQLGPVLGSATLRSAPEMKVDGLGAAFSLDMGYALSPELTVHGRYALVNLIIGTAKLGGEQVGAGEEPSVTASMLAASATYYLMPLNAFATLAIGLGVASMEVDQFRETKTDMGWAFNLDLGKEWWFSDNAAMGVVLRGWFSAMAAESDANVFFPAGAVLFSASYQ